MDNPFQYGREIGAVDIVDRTVELASVERAVRDGNKLFLIGPRRFGKTSILRAAQDRLASDGAIVLRFDATAFPSIDLLVARIVSSAAKSLKGGVERVAAQVSDFFARIRPDIHWSPVEREWSVGLGVARRPNSEPELLVDALNGLERLAAAQPAHRPVGLILDEFQRIIELGGSQAEDQIRAAVQRHSRVGYVFAGSKTRMLREMVSNPERPFYRLGDVINLGPVPRVDFSAFLRGGFERTGYRASEEFAARILDLACDVPYNVQSLASHCWYRLVEGGVAKKVALTTGFVDETLNILISQLDPIYAEIWGRQTAIKQRVLVAVVSESGRNLTSDRVQRAISKGAGTIRKSLQSFVSDEILREEKSGKAIRYWFEDPYFAHWIRLTVIEG